VPGRIAIDGVAHGSRFFADGQRNATSPALLRADGDHFQRANPLAFGSSPSSSAPASLRIRVFGMYVASGTRPLANFSFGWERHPLIFGLV